MSSTTSSNLPVNDILRTQSPVDHGIPGSFLGKYYMRIAIGRYQRPKPFGSPTLDAKLFIFLPLPRALADSTSVGYSDQNLETMGDFMNSAASVQAIGLRQGGNLATGVAGGLARIAGALGLNPVSKAVGAVTQGLNSILPTDTITSAIQQVAGLAPNPNPSVAFTGPILRTVNYDWSLYPKNKNESIAIQRMIRALKRSALPKNATDKSAAVLGYPDVCQLNFYPWDKGGSGEWGWVDATEDRAGSIIKYKKCVMQNVQVSYAAGGAAVSFFEGTNLPTSYELSIEFKEIEYMLSKDWDKGTLPPGIAPNGIVTIASALKTSEIAFDAIKESLKEAAGTTGGADIFDDFKIIKDRVAAALKGTFP
jgi:hypothetical protein